MNYGNHYTIFTSPNFFIVFFFTYIKISKDSSAKYYQDNKKDYKNKLMKDIAAFLKKKKKIKATIRTWTIQQSTRIQQIKACWV